MQQSTTSTYVNLHTQLCINLLRPSIGLCHHQSFLMDDCTTKQLEIDQKWVFLIFFANLTLK